MAWATKAKKRWASAARRRPTFQFTELGGVSGEVTALDKIRTVCGGCGIEVNGLDEDSFGALPHKPDCSQLKIAQIFMRAEAKRRGELPKE